MANDEKNQRIQKSVKKFARTLLATTCLTVASGGAAMAGTLPESNYGGDFGNTFATLTNLGTLTDASNTVTGTVSCPACTDSADFFEFSGLNPGGFFTLVANQGVGNSLSYTVLNSSNGSLGSPSGTQIISTNNTVTGNVPGDGNIVVGVQSTNVEGGNTYSVTLRAPLAGVPEPSTLSAVGLALAGAFAWRRKRHQ